jgi:hypothetical protein
MTTATSDALPFGLAIAARQPIATDHVDESELMFDEHQQIMLVRGSSIPWCKHSDGKTTTNSNTDGAGGLETDEDWTED